MIKHPEGTWIEIKFIHVIRDVLGQLKFIEIRISQPRQR